MDTCIDSWISNLDLNNCDFGDHNEDLNELTPVDSFEDLGELITVPDDYNFQQTLSPESQTFSDQTDSYQRPKKQVKRSHNQSQSPAKASQKRSTGVTKKSPPELHDRVMAERKRREKLSQRFIALTAIIPGLKKMDKATVLGDAIGYVKQLQEHVKVLEEKLKSKPVGMPFSSQSSLSDESTSSTDATLNSCPKIAHPGLEVRITDTNVLVRIQCKKEKGTAAWLLDEVERLDLTVASSIFFPIGENSMDVTIFAQVKDGCDMTANDLMRNLRSALNQKS